MGQRKQSEGFNLAFLDIMSCGLGAVVLVFMLVKHNINDSSVELKNLENDIQNFEVIKQDSIQFLQKIETQISEESSQAEAIKKKLAKLQSVLTNKNTNIGKISREIESLKSNIVDIEIGKKEDLVETEQVNEENYLLGLKVEGQKIAILLDSSASMTNEKLIDIIKTKNSSKKDKQQADKWVRTKKIVAWLLARLPKNSDIVVVTFNEKAKILGKQGWMKAIDPLGLSSILSDLNKLVPEGGTNLQSGLRMANKYSPSNLYLITDGLPTKGESRYKNLNPFASCNSLLGTSNTISGECRIKLFKKTIAESKQEGVQINVVLLPVEGDPDAVNQYWYWSASTGGLVISPANNWP